MDADINMLAVVFATVASIAVGFVWYMPKVFGNAWMKMAKIKPESGDMLWSMGSVFVSSFIMAYVLAHFTGFAHHVTIHEELGNSFLKDALLTGVWAWFGFQALRFFMHDQFNQRRKKESLIHIGNDFVTIMVMALVIGLMGVK